MEQKFLLKTTALRLLEEIYLKSDSSLRTIINTYALFNNDYEKILITKASQYLIKKKYVETDMVACENWRVSITADGIDWVEECHKIF